MTRFAVLVKQIPAFEQMMLGPAGRLVRDHTALEMSAYCRRAVSKAVEFAADDPDSSIVVFTLGPSAAEDALREAIAWGLDRGVDIRGVLITDPDFAGSDTIATARLLAAAINREGPFDLVLAGKNSLDGDTGQVPPQLAELLDLPFAAGVKVLALHEQIASVGCEHDDGWLDAEVMLPAVLSCAERLCEPAKVSHEGRAAVPAQMITTLSTMELGPGPWGGAASLTDVGETRNLLVQRSRQIDADAPLADQVSTAVRILRDSGALDGDANAERPALGATNGPGPLVAVLAEPDRDLLTQELCGAAARLAESLHGSTVLLAAHELSAATAGSWGADRLVIITGSAVEEEIAGAVAQWARARQPWAILAGSTSFGREIAARVAVSIGAGLTGDTVDLEVVDGRLVAWKPAFGGSLAAAITARSPVQMASVRPGVLTRPRPRVHTADVESITGSRRDRIRIRLRRQEDSLERLGEADAVVGIGAGVAPEELSRFGGLCEVLGAELGCTRKVTDGGWMPHSSQIGITGRSISPRVYVAVGTSGKFNHMVGVRSAGTVFAINSDPTAPVWDHADVGIVGDWRECIDMLETELRREHGLRQSGDTERTAANSSLRR
ncbi:FAD-binding protein [Mycobacterium sp. CVI_P3]|uniref:FAD-binding protein n=1 Tax=Mycobacterium pinniadriaticum TaxID=2994102 RepID=A0ABT3SGT3_9MYCO|nr:FAD-binding protein [Mycobacterium pinniadriaticum]MCX2932413.1 FAD-binding protein [Mycobacterium pinniadriaticum]MCX2938730.1 FAD-binding protein [Mycobacterium pinniadriaticum]